MASHFERLFLTLSGQLQSTEKGQEFHQSPNLSRTAMAATHQTDCAAVRLRVGGNDAAQLPPLTVGRAAGLSSPV